VKDGVRVDRWLWSARFYRTRALAAEAIDGGKVQVNDTRAKRARPVRVGDRIRIRKNGLEYHLTVAGLSERRLGPTRAGELYEETPESVKARTDLLEQRRLARLAAAEPAGRPSKRDRRRLARLKGRG